MTKLMFFDLETTGLDSRACAIHQMSGEIVINGKTREQFNFKIRPHDGAMISEEALEVSGVTKDQIMEYTESGIVYNKFVKMLGKYVDKYNKKDKFFLVGYNNAHFDNEFLRAFFDHNDDRYFGSWFWSNSIDVMVIASLYTMKTRAYIENFKQSTVAKFLGIPVEEDKLHDAMYDIYLCREILKRVAKRWELMVKDQCPGVGLIKKY